MGTGKILKLLLLSFLFMFFAYDLVRAIYRHNGTGLILFLALGTIICTWLIFGLFQNLLKGKDNGK